jgi:8-oxo-(d)GTP phosphatase
VTLVLVRHAWAGDSDEWEGDDRLRPLDERGRRQAEALADELARFALARVVSSLYLRCVQTVEPLARRRGLPIEEREEAAEEADHASAFGLLRELGSTDALVCTHGEVLELLLGDETEKGETTVVELGGDGLRVLEQIPPPV